MTLTLQADADIENDVSVGTYPKFFSYSLSRGHWLGDDSCAGILTAGLLINTNKNLNNNNKDND